MLFRKMAVAMVLEWMCEHGVWTKLKDLCTAFVSLGACTIDKRSGKIVLMEIDKSSKPEGL